MAAPSINGSSQVSYFTASPSGNNTIDPLLDTSKWGGGIGTSATVYYSFPTSNASQLWSNLYQNPSNPELSSNFQGLSTAQINAAKQALTLWGNVANINFIEVTTESSNAVGDIRIANTDIADANTYAYAYLPAAFNPIGGDIWFNNTQPVSGGNDYSIGANGFQTMLHEIGHAIGLNHPFEGSNPLAASFDHHQYTVMSYSIAQGNNSGSSSYYPTTPMVLDIQALQYLYGANTSYNTGDNTYTYSASGTYYETIWDAGGNDTIVYTGTSNGTIDLSAGSFSQLGQAISLGNGATQSNTVGIAYNVVIENATSGSGNDTIKGNNASNNISGGDGSDKFITDINKTDITKVLVSNDNVRVYSTNQTDTLTSIESVEFANGETLTISALMAMASQTPTFRKIVNNVEVNVTPTVYNGPVSFLEYEVIGDATGEVIYGSSSNDFINLQGGDDAADSGAGTDVVDGGLGSNFLTGGSGNDVFFIDGRAAHTTANDVETWSTITDFSAGDSINIWGYQAGLSRVVETLASAGAAGYTGATFVYDLDNDGVRDTTITFSGLSVQDVPSSSALSTSDGNNYLLFTL